MKLYRAIEFSKLSFMLSDYGIDEWNKTIESFKTSHEKKNNWWFDTKFNTQIEYIIADIISNGQNSFFQKSLTYNSIVGGRYNPANSFGVLYTANNPTLAALEVLFHIYDNKRDYLSNMAKSSEDFSATFDEVSPHLAKDLIVIFAIEIDETLINIEDCTSEEKIKDLIKNVGFARYTDHEDFDDDFIFGNTYEISRILGCHLNTSQNTSAYKFKSARIENTLENQEYSNIIFPETFVKDGFFKILPEYYLAQTSLNIQETNGAHEVEISFVGKEQVNSKIVLEKYMNEKKVKFNADRLKIYRPVLPADLQPSLNTRRVLFQRFKDYTGK